MLAQDLVPSRLLLATALTEVLLAVDERLPCTTADLTAAETGALYADTSTSDLLNNRCSFVTEENVLKVYTSS